MKGMQLVEQAIRKKHELDPKDVPEEIKKDIRNFVTEINKTFGPIDMDQVYLSSERPECEIKCRWCGNIKYKQKWAKTKSEKWISYDSYYCHIDKDIFDMDLMRICDEFKFK